MDKILEELEKEVESEEEEESGLLRRHFFFWIGGAGLFALLGGFLLSCIRFFKPRVLYEPPTFFKAGYSEEYPVGKVVTKWVKEHRVWIVRNEEGIYALLAKCTHLGCTPTWFEGENHFKCPCHGSNFSVEGDVVAGPAPEPLFRVSIGFAPDGQILVDKSLQENKPKLREAPPFLFKV